MTTIGKLYTIKEASKLLGYANEQSLYHRISNLNLPVTRVGGKIFVKLSDMYSNCQMCGSHLTKYRHKYCNTKCYKDSYKSNNRLLK